MIKLRFAGALGAVAAATLSPSVLSARDLTFEDRVAAQRAIEQVNWNHRIWPKENPQLKPPLSAVMSDDAIRATVEDYIEKSNALERLWHRPITAEQLQAEMNRMASNSHDPQLLQELFAALADDPYVIAETLARQTLADRLIRSWYANDPRFHGDTRARASTALEACSSVDCMNSLGGEYRKTTLNLQADLDAVETRVGDDVVRLDPNEWKEQLDALAESIPSGRLSPLEETADSFIVRAVVTKRSGAVTIASVSWAKRSFDTWWSGQRRPGSSLTGVTASFVPAAITSAGCTSDTWTATAGGVADQRRYHTAVWTGAEVIVWGGETAGGYAVTGGRYNPSTDNWTPTSTADAPWIGRVGHTAVWTGTEMIIWGGRYAGSGNTSLNDGDRYNPSTDTWTKDTTSNPLQARAYHSAVWTGSEMIVWGGYYRDNFGFFHALNSGGRYNPLGDYYTAWTATSTGANVPAARYSHSAVWTGTQMIVWGGGYDGTTNNQLNTGGRYDPASDSWTATSTTNVPTERVLHSAVWTGTEMLIWGGVRNNIPTNSGGLYEPASDTWVATSTGTNVPTARSWHGAVWTGTEMIIWGGAAGDAQLNTGGRYHPATATWKSTSVGANVPAARFGFTTVWTGTEMIVWGGSASGAFYTNTGGRYDPSIDVWVPTSTSPNLPSARSTHTALWTGAEMIIWGGMTDTTEVNTGGRYNPSTDAWTATSTGASVPVARRWHTAVWTGTEMIVWGGYKSSSSSLDSGGRYNPGTNSWTSTSIGPAARRGHSAVWTGNAMIVWGGLDSSTLMNTGGRYDPSADVWTATSTVHAPFPRAAHTAVWTGSEMIVWGGQGCTGTPDCDGSRYNPATDDWTDLPTGANAPSPRTAHAAAWTGTEMIVWGGGYTSGPSTTYLNTGSRYNPAMEKWIPTSTGANVPTGRYAPSAVWTGARMIVWGGYGANGYVSSGGRYDPLTNSWTATSPVNAPTWRYGHTATWTGSEMIIWGGTPLTTSGGRYCGCLASRTVYHDADGDGYGDATTSASSNCDGSAPAGYVDNAGDCNDGDSTVSPGAPEVNDGIDNQCAGSAGFGVIDEISGLSGFMTAGDTTLFSWPPQVGASSYDVVRSTTPDFSTGCVAFSSNDPFLSDPESPAEEGSFYYLVRASTPHVGSWGQRHDGTPRGGGCLTP